MRLIDEHAIILVRWSQGWSLPPQFGRLKEGEKDGFRFADHVFETESIELTTGAAEG